jgi:hypothetical protein
VDHLGEVGRLEVLVALQQLGGALVRGGLVQPQDVLDGDGHRRSSPPGQTRERACGPTLPDEHLHGYPVAGALPLDGDILHGGVDEAVLEPYPHRPVEQLCHHEGLVGPLLEAAHVDQPRGDHLAAVDRGNPGHRHEHPAPPRHLHDQADHPRPAPRRAEGHHDVANPADLVAEGVEHAQPSQPGHEDP